ncbi:ileal sodium/bile acid cotransporter-like [Ostrea edulis]|uniref:ileal sodium/bile acid cotransporter-like n=1 Tax=Ostrea edulis TaxID=37623 RepID=UPI0024AFFE84|nr:ileal sodium/bile acid cotransporter-like [Ostrea edulis]
METVTALQTSENVTMFSNVTGISATPGPSTLKMVFDIAINVMLITIMFGMGSITEIAPLLKHIKRPFGILIGMMSQFVVLPLVTFGLAHALTLPNVPALGMLVMGCCPSGSTSNVFSYWVDGDVPLSISMTTASTVLAFGLMPLNLLIYSGSWTDDNLVIPYINLLTAFAMTITPVLLGILLRWKFPKIAMVVVKIGSIAGALSVILNLTLLSLLYPFMYNASWKIYLGAFLLPFIGFLFGYVVASIFRMEHFQRRTVALETGIQNFPLCMTLLTLSFTKSRFAEISLFPLLYGVTCLLASVVFAVVYRVVNVIKGKVQKQEVMENCNGENIQEKIETENSVCRSIRF